MVLRVNGRGGNDRITIADSVLIDAWVSGGNGRDQIQCGGGNDDISGEQGKDVIDGGAGNDEIHGGEGKDTLRGGSGEDEMHGDEGQDYLAGGDDDDRLFGENGNDSIHGDEGDDYGDGGRGKDNCHGGLGNDRLKGGAGNDHLDGDEGDDLLDGDEGRNSLVDGTTTDLDLEFRALLSGLGDAWGRADLEFELEHGQLEIKFEVEVRYLAANTTYDIVVAGFTVGQITTDQEGEGKVEFSSVHHEDELPLPEGFPSLNAGATVSIGMVLQGEFARKYDD